ncbi:MAG: hypothetical protein QNJ98_18455 [Planctomycetota bacterium]|nr:hypothetical protein [Planctomycetota bacterium]
MSMSIAHDERLLNDLLDGRLSDAEAEAVRARLTAEPELQELYEQLESVSQAVRAWDPAAALDAPSALADGVRDRIRAEGPAAAAPSAPPRGRMLRMMSYAYAAAAVVVLGVTLAVTLGDDPEPATHDLATEQQPEATNDGLEAPPTKKPANAGKVWDDAGESKEARDALQKKSKGGRGGAEPSGGIATPVEAPAPAQDMAKDAEAQRKQPARMGPGGAVPPGLREPSDLPTEPRPRKTDGPTAGNRPKGEFAKRASPATNDARDDEDTESLGALAEADPAITYVLKVDDIASARANLQLLLAEVRSDDRKRKRERGTAKLVDALVADGARFFKQTRPEKPAAPAAEAAPKPPAAAPAPTTPSGPAPVPEADEDKQAKARAKAEPARQVVVSTLSAEAFARFEALTRDRRLASRLDESQRHEGGRAPATPGAPRAAPGDQAEKAAPDAPTAKRGRGADKAAPVRVRIVLVQR